MRCHHQYWLHPLEPFQNGDDPGAVAGIGHADRHLGSRHHSTRTGILHLAAPPCHLRPIAHSGEPELPHGFDPKSPDHLDGAAIKTLLFGHETQGRNIGTGEAYRRVTTNNGTTNVTVGDWSEQGVSHIEGDMLCVYYLSQNRFCAVIFRNPSGTLEQMNEYLFVNQQNRFEFSVAK